MGAGRSTRWRTNWTLTMAQGRWEVVGDSDGPLHVSTPRAINRSSRAGKVARGLRSRRAPDATGCRAHPRSSPVAAAALAALLLACAATASMPAAAQAAIAAPQRIGAERRPTRERRGSSLETAAAKAGSTGRAVAMSLIGLAFAVAATVLAFRRDFKEAAGVFAVGIVSVLLATPAGRQPAA